MTRSLSDQVGDGVDHAGTARGRLDQAKLTRSLNEAGIPPDTAREVASTILWAEGVLLYGSWARGQAHPTSDVDLLLLNGASLVPHQLDQKLSIAHYSAQQLVDANETLFGMHLARDGRVLLDETGRLRALLDGIAPPDPTVLLARIYKLTAVVDATDRDREMHIQGLCKVARYLLRSAIYATALLAGRPSFSLDDLASVMGDHTLPRVLSSHVGVHPEASTGVLDDLAERLGRLFGSLPENPFGSLEALAVGAWEDDTDLSSMATLALSNETELPYEDLPKVIL